MTKFENNWGIHTGEGLAGKLLKPTGLSYFQAKPSPVWIPKLFSNLVIVYLLAYENGTECSETSAYKIQTPGELPSRKHTIDLSYFQAKPSLICIPQLFSNLVIVNLLAYEDGTDRVF